MKALKVAAIAALIAAAAMYGWYFLASAVNEHADRAATLIIQDTMSANQVFYLRKLSKIRQLIEEKSYADASELANELIELNLTMIESCVTEKCTEVRAELEGKPVL